MSVDPDKHKEILELFIRFFEGIATPQSKNCSACGYAEMQIMPWIAEIELPISSLTKPENSLKDIPERAKLYPAAIITCARCGYTRYHNLISAGILDPNTWMLKNGG